MSSILESIFAIPSLVDQSAKIWLDEHFAGTVSPGDLFFNTVTGSSVGTTPPPPLQPPAAPQTQSRMTDGTWTQQDAVAGSMAKYDTLANAFFEAQASVAANRYGTTGGIPSWILIGAGVWFFVVVFNQGGHAR